MPDDLAALVVGHEMAFRKQWGYRRLDPADWWAERVDVDAGLSTVATHDGEIVGFCLCGRGRVAELGVSTDWRRRGIGERLLRHAIHELLREKARPISLEVDGANDSGARELYDRAGFVRLSATTIWAAPLAAK